MKTHLPKRSLVEKEKLDEIVREILFATKPQIAKIVLFGSYARGDWTDNSDFDIMVLLKKTQTARKNAEIEIEIEEHLDLKGIYMSPPVSLIVEPIKRVNQELGKEQYFFSDIIKQGVLLYDGDGSEFAKPRELSPEERVQVARRHFDAWFPSGVNFIFGTRNMMGRSLKLGAFLLHQATESFFTAILLVVTNYKKKMHDIYKLEKIAIARSKSKELTEVFPQGTKKEKELFKLLIDAYLKARYEETYQITEEELLYLIGRVEKLKEVTEKICLEWINKD